MPAMPGMDMSRAGEGGCGAPNMTDASVNLHYHGTNTPPLCHQDEVIQDHYQFRRDLSLRSPFPEERAARPLLVSSTYPRDLDHRRPGWSDRATYCRRHRERESDVVGLPQRVMVVRDNQPVNPPPRPLHKPRVSKPADDDAAADLSVNYIPIGGPAFIPALFR